MRIAELLNAMASWLESPNNEALLLAESDEQCMQVVAQSCVLAAALLKTAAEEVDHIEPPAESKITPESIQEIANLAAAFDCSGDPDLKKQASVLDELLLSIASPPNAYASRKDLHENRALELQKKYHDPQEALQKKNKIADSEKQINNSNMTKNYPINQFGLSSRSCPDHPGAQLGRVGEHMYQCEMDKKVYNYETGYTLNDGTKVPGGDVSLQTHGLDAPYHSMFDSRETRLQTNKP